MTSLESLFRKQEVHADLPRYPAKDGPALAREIKTSHLTRLQRLRSDITTELDAAEDALLTILEAHEEKQTRRERLRAFVSPTGASAVPTSATRVGGARR